jgi:hypothetical protein
MNEWMDGGMDGWMDGGMDGWMDGWMNGWMDGWMIMSSLFCPFFSLLCFTRCFV